MGDGILRPQVELTQPLFLFGTLRDPELYQIVAGEPLQGRPAVLDGWHAASCEGGRFPVLIEGGQAEGVLASPSEAALSRLDFYELGFGYERVTVEVTSDGGTVVAFAYRARGLTGAGDWHLGDWQGSFAPLSREAAREYMALFGRLSPQEGAVRYGTVLSRAACRLEARANPSPRGPGPQLDAAQTRLDRAETPHVGFFSLRKDHLRFPLFGGGLSAPVSRESLVASDAATVLPYDPEADSVLLLRQWRHGPFVRDDPNPWTLEPVAGRVDVGETAEEAARREMKEEAGIEAHRLHRIAVYYPSPGLLTEHVTSFLGIARLEGLDGTVAGLDSEAEDIMLHVLPFERLMEMIDCGAANTGTLVLSALWLARARDRLRRDGFS